MKSAHNPLNTWLCKKAMHLTNHEESVYNGCSEPLTEGTVLYSPFFLLASYFWQMTQMSDKCRLCKTEKNQYLNKLRLFEFV